MLPAGIFQAWASVTHALWFARSAEVVHSRLIEILVWMRVPGDIVFALGCLVGYPVRLLRRPVSHVATQPSSRAQGREALAER